MSTRSLRVAFLLVLGISIANAQSPMQSVVGDLHTARNDYERRLFNELSCTCECPHALNECGGECSPGMQRRHQIQLLIDGGVSRDEIIEREVAKYGVRALRVPPNRGFNRLAWLLPFAAILLSLGGLVVIATRLKRRNSRPSQKTDVTKAALTTAEEDRLEDELDALD